MKFYINTLGCPKNVVDSEMMSQLLARSGHKALTEPRQADVIIVNTCGFIAPARDESYETLQELASGLSPRQKLVAAGCMAQSLGEEIRRRVPQVAAVIGTRNWPEIVSVLDQLDQDLSAQVKMSAEANLVASVERRANMGATAYLKIADGCDAACAFCAIPLIKGPQRSKPREEVLREANELAAQGVRELILIAQDTTAYGRDLYGAADLSSLVREISAAAPETDWLRILYAYPQHVDQGLIDTMSHLAQVCHYLDLPLQHGHPDVLRRMRRPHDVDTIYRLVEALRSAMPDIALRSTFIVGFPGETEREFEGLLDLLEAIRFDKVGMFAYSVEDGTAAAEIPKRVPAEVIAERYERAMLAQQEISLQRNQEMVGRDLAILIDGAGDGISVGRSYRDAPEIDGMVLLAEELPVGELVLARIIAAQEYDLVAEPVE